MTDEKVIDVAEPTMAVAVRETVSPPSLFGTTDPVAIVAEASKVAGALKDVVKRQGLISNIKGKEYPRCEAWTLLGTMLGIFPVLAWTRPVEHGWEARVEAKLRDGTIVGAAEAECLRTESNWANRDDFALRSMAQTRATAKALRMPLGFVMTLSGFEATPAEEMTFEQAKPQPKPSPAKPKLVMATEEQREKMITRLNAHPSQDSRKIVTEYFEKIGALIPTEEIEDLPLQFVPVMQSEFIALHKAITDFEAGGEAKRAFDPHIEGEPTTKTKQATATQPPPASTDSKDEPWRSFPTPFGKHAGVMLGNLDKNVLFGFWANYTVETHYNGKPKKEETIQKDRIFREMLDAAGRHYDFKKND